MDTEAQRLLKEGLSQLAGEGSESRYLEYCEPLLAYFELYRQWLASRHDPMAANPVALLKHQIIDCLAVSEDIFAIDVLDVCSGQAVPGLPMAITHPIGTFTLLEPDAERARFLESACQTLQLTKVSVVNLALDSYHTDRLFHEIVCRENIPVNL